jgi:hypothetical protein
MIRVDNELWTPSPIDEERLPTLQWLALLDIVRTGANRHGLAPDDLSDDAARAYLAAARPDRMPVEVADAAERLLVEAFGRSPCGDAKAEMEAFVKRLEEAADMHGMPTDLQAAHAAATLRQARSIREAERREVEALRAVKADPTPETREAYREAMTRTDAAKREVPAARRSLDDMVEAVLARASLTQGKDAVGLRTPRFPHLSTALFGWRGLCFIAAAPGIGKTTLAVAAGIDAVEADPTACFVFVSFEMPTPTLVERVLCDMAGIPQRTLRIGSSKGSSERGPHGVVLERGQHDSLEEARQRLRAMSARVALVGKDDVGMLRSRAADGRDCMSKVEALALDLKRRSACSRSFVVVDHLAVVPVERPDGQPFANDTERTRFILSGLTTLRDRLDGDANPVVVIAQARKGDWDNAGLASVMGTADTAYSADAVVVMQREEEKDDAPAASNARQALVAKIVKGRDMMWHSTVRMSFDPMSSSIAEEGLA